MGHWRFVTITEQARRTTIGHEVAAVVSRCTERRLGKKKYPKSFFNFMELLKGEHLKSVSEWLLPLREKDFGEDGLPLSYRSKWFKKEMHVRKEGSKVVEYPVYFPKIPLWMLRFGHERHYHAEQWIPNGDVETELDHIHKYLDGHFAIDLLKGRFFADRVYDLNLIKKSALERIIRKETMEEALAPLV